MGDNDDISDDEDNLSDEYKKMDSTSYNNHQGKMTKQVAQKQNDADIEDLSPVKMDSDDGWTNGAPKLAKDYRPNPGGKKIKSFVIKPINVSKQPSNNV